MVVDIKLSSDSVAEFQEQLKTTGHSLPISFSALVLQSAAWPLVQTVSALLLPDVLTNAMKRVCMRPKVDHYDCCIYNTWSMSLDNYFSDLSVD